MKIEEEFLHFIWQNRLFSHDNLSVENTQVEIIQPGVRNTYSGPDFSFSKIKIGDTTWAGNVEIHVKTSDWFKHQHQNDEAYKNVILHVVYENDVKADELPPCLELKNLINPKVIANYQSIKSAKEWLPCAKLFHLSNPIKNNIWFERLLIERIERKTKEISSIYHKSAFDLEQTFFVFLSKSLGLKANSFPFELLSVQTPLKILLKYSDQPEVIESILLGQAGFLQKPTDDYAESLQKKYLFYKSKHQLEPITQKIWKTGGLRPFNQPSLKIGQLSKLIINLFPFTDRVLFFEINQLKKLLKVKPSVYWNSHYSLGNLSVQKEKSLGDATINNLLINAVVPFYFFVAKHRVKPDLKEKALNLLEQIPAEKNSIINKWKTFNVETKSAWNTQSLLEQKNNYCNKLYCLVCGIGHQVIKST